MKQYATTGKFESCVVLDGDKTLTIDAAAAYAFESCVVLDGDKTGGGGWQQIGRFESCVVLDGDKTFRNASQACFSLRVVLF